MTERLAELVWVVAGILVVIALVGPAFLPSRHARVAHRSVFWAMAVMVFFGGAMIKWG